MQNDNPAQDPSDDIPASEAARALGRLGASKGGRARAAKLDPEQKAEIAKAAAEARWGLPKAFMESPLPIGGVQFECAVLEDRKTRVLSERSFMDTMGMYYSGWVSTQNREAKEGSAVLPLYLSFAKLKPFISRHLDVLQLEPLKYRTLSGNVAHGIRAELIPQICRVWIDAAHAGGLGKRQVAIAEKARVLLDGLGTVGIVALIDEATGFQRVRESDALATILEAFIAKELAEWVKTFEDDFYDEIYRIKKWKRSEGSSRTQLLGKITNDIIYDRLGPGIKDELLRITPRDKKGRLLNKMHRSLTRNFGYIALKAHLKVVTALLKITPDGQWGTFMHHLDTVCPKWNSTALLRFEVN